MTFLDREAELELLEDHLGRRGAGLFVLYGRRRIGKTALLEQVVGSRDGAAYHVATRSTITDELSRISRTLARDWRMPLLEAQPPASIDALLALLESVDEPRVLVLDELPYLVESAPALPGQLQASWDRTLSRGKLKLVVCGSSVGMMEETFLLPKAPLFGRRTGQLRLGPLPPAVLGDLFSGDGGRAIEHAALFGGVPGYVLRCDPETSLETNLLRHVLTRGEPLHEEVPFLLREELREPRVYTGVLSTIAAGSRKFGEISSKVGLDRSNLSRYLATLSELGLIEREVPVTERQPDKSRKGLYRIADPFVATWFAFVHPNRGLLERGRAREVLDSRVRPFLPTHLGRAVEPVLADLLRSGPWARLVPFDVDAAGRHWGPDTELDLVLLDAERRRAFVAEVKWTRRAVSRSTLDKLRRRVADEPAFEGMGLTYALVSRSGFRPGREPRLDERLLDVSSSPLE